MRLYLTPVAIGYLTQLLLVTLISSYFCTLLRRSGRDPHIVWLTSFFIALTAFMATLFLEAALLPTPRLYAVFLQNPFLGVALTCLLQFDYHFPAPTASLRHEARAALALSGGYTLWETGYAVFRLLRLQDGQILYRPNWSDYVLLLFLLWVPLSFYRQIVASSAPAHGRRRWVQPLLHPATPEARATRGFTLIFAFVAGLSVFNILRGAHLVSVALANLGISVGILLALFNFTVVYLNYRPETTTLILKLVGVTLTVTLAIMGGIGWAISPTFEKLYQPTLFDRHTLRFSPNAAGGYTVSDIPFAFAEEREKKLDLAEDAARTCSGALDFAFPFYGQTYAQVYACNDGTLSFGQGITYQPTLAYRMYQYRYGAGAPLILPLLTDLYPEISSPGGIFVQQEMERLVVTWDRLRGFTQQDVTFTFQAILYLDGVFDFSYKDLPAQLAYHPNDDPGASAWAVGALPGGLERRTGPTLAALTTLPLDTGPQGILQDYHLEFRQHLHKLFAPLARLILIASLFIVVGFPSIFQVTLVTPLNALVQGVTRIQDGDYASPVPVRHSDEIGFLTRAFNALAAELSDLIHNLEARIVARTAELNAANTQLRIEIAEREQAQATVVAQQRDLARLEERTRLGRELHDGLGQMLGYINVQAQTVDTMLTSRQITSAQANLARIVETAQTAHADIRHYILGLRPEDVPQLDFWEALGSHLRQFQTTYGIETRLSLPDEAPSPDFGPAAEDQLLHIIQEALTNTRKHAKAQRVEVLFHFAPTTTHVIIVDDGIGFSPPSVPPVGGEVVGYTHANAQSSRLPPSIPPVGGEEGRPPVGGEEGRPPVEGEEGRPPVGGEKGGHPPRGGDQRGGNQRGVMHFGLQMMRERAQTVGGQLEIRSAPGQGTCLLVYIPHLAPAPSLDAKTSDLTGLRLLLVDDHPLFLEGLRNMLTARGFAVLGVAHDGQAALEQARALRPDVMVMDLHMPGGGGLQATRAIKAEMPEIKVVMLTVAEDDANLFEAIKSGASGYLLKSLDANRFCTLLSSVLHGDMPLAPGMAARIMAELSHRESDETTDEGRDHLTALTSHQQEILNLVAQGMIYKEVAEHLHLSEKTIKYHMAQIVEKLQVENRAQAIAYFHRVNQEQE